MKTQIGNLVVEWPDSRLNAPLRTKRDKDGNEWEPVFCINCGAPGGHALRSAAMKIFVYVCPKCEASVGELPMPKVSDEALERAGLVRRQDATA